MPATTIRGVIAHLDDIISWSRVAPSRVGFFAALYRKVTVQVRDDIEAGRFGDGERMEALDVAFANRYLDAVSVHWDAGRPTASWEVAFDASGSWRPLIVQQLLVGINAHINLDLGIASAAVAPGEELATLRADFMAINGVLAGMVGGVLEEMGRLSPWIGLLDRVGGRTERKLINFSLDVARREAWSFAERLAGLDPAAAAVEIERRDREVAALGRRVVHPGPVLSTASFLVKVREAKHVATIIEELAE